LRVNMILFWSLLLTTLSAVAGLAHLYELPSKLRLGWQDYLTVQQIYRGWSLLGGGGVGLADPESDAGNPAA